MEKQTKNDTLHKETQETLMDKLKELFFPYRLKLLKTLSRYPLWTPQSYFWNSLTPEKQANENIVVDGSVRLMKKLRTIYGEIEIVKKRYQDLQKLHYLTLGKCYSRP